MRWLLPFAVALVWSPGALAGSLPSPCALLTNTEVAKALGSKVAYRTDQHGTCTWNGVALSAYTSANATLSLSVTRASKTAFRKGELESAGAVSISGIGQLAYATPRSNVAFLVVWKDGVALYVLVSGVVSPLEIEKAVATIALRRASPSI
jgi:hypothetical protein